MSLLIVQKQTQAGEYNFKNDPAAGAVGTSGLSVFIPVRSTITRFFVKTLVAPLSAGAAVIGFNAGAAGLLFNPLGYGAFVEGAALAGVDFNANPAQFGEFEITMSIGVAAITAGRIAFVIEYDVMDV